MATRKASAVWEGGIKSGKGTFKGESGAIAAPYSFGGRFEQAGGANPEELLAAAHAACFSMALSGGLERNGTVATKIETEAACTIEKFGDGFKIMKMKLTTRVTAPNLDNEKLQSVAEGAKSGCPISLALQGNMEIELDAKLV